MLELTTLNYQVASRDLLEAGFAPEWASGWGQDCYGVWVEITVSGVVQKLRWIPPGEFLMGSPESEVGRDDDEGPQHTVVISQGYWLFDIPVTQALWEAVMGNNPSKYKSPRRPVESVNWHDANDFIVRLNESLPGLNLSLPTEAQWEYACRAGTDMAMYAGNLEIVGGNNAPVLDAIAWYGGNSGEGYELEEGYDSSQWPEKQYPHNKAGTREVATKQPNGWGLYDMLGNVWEWCQDGRRDYVDQAERDPVGPQDEGSSRVLRGGSWGISARDVRAACRYHFIPDLRDDDIGFRCARVQERAESRDGQGYGMDSPLRLGYSDPRTGAVIPSVETETPLENYKQDLKRPDFSHDVAQEQAALHLDRLYHELVKRHGNRLRSILSRLSASKALQNPCQGLYLWGGAGRGKTYLLDIFYQRLPFRRKMRIHFRRFMQRVHKELRQLQGEKNPLDIVARTLADEAVVLCIDEFFVSEITDAMILGGLMEKLFNHGVTLVATSNILPDNLYKDGLQRARFLPAVALINKYTLVVNMDSGPDYRLRVLEQAEIYHSPLDEAAEISLEQSFVALVPEVAEHPSVEVREIDINDRSISVRKVAADILWCDFRILCDGPRSQNDYIELARIYHVVLVSGVPQMGAAQDDVARRFVNMVDEFYDRNVKLIMSGAVPIEKLYGGGRLEFEFQRTRSRLLKMQSHEYLALPHRP